MASGSTGGMQTAVLGGGCFWCLEAVFEQLQGVSEVVSGYSGGHVPNPTYEEVCSGRTGHAEVVRITFDPGLVSYPELLEVFFTIHDPTTRDRQGNDIGSQYRSVIFWTDEEQKAQAEAVIQDMEAKRVWPAPVVTQVEPAREFYPAEGYHQEYFRLHATQPYCQVVVAPKVAKFRSRFAARLRA